MLRAVLVFPVAVFGAIFVAAGCQSLPSVAAACGEIPPNGCPTGRGGTCADVSCAALYDCVNSVWTVAETCDTPSTVAKPVVRSVAVAGVAPGVVQAGSTCTPVTIDVSSQTKDCTVDLMFPDCPAAAAQGCAEHACLTGCSDFFVCSSTAWVDVAHCDASGRLTVTQKPLNQP